MTDYNVASKTPKSVFIDASSSNIPTGFSTAATSLVVTGIARADVLQIISTVSSDWLAVNYVQGSVSSAPTEVTLYVPPSATGLGQFSSVTIDNCQLSSTIYIKSKTASAPITSGSVVINVG